MKASTKYFYGIGIGVILLLIPVVLNWVLQKESPFGIQVITNEQIGSSATWLVFWGPYLAACASFTMALVSFLQNKKIRKQNSARIEYELALKQYEELEKFVLDADKIISENAFIILCRHIEKEGIDSLNFLQATYEYKNALVHLQKRSLKLINIDSELQTEYSAILKSSYALVNRLLEILPSIYDSKHEDKDYQQFLQSFPVENGGKSECDKFIIFAKQQFEKNRIYELYDKGSKFLESTWDVVQTKLNNTK